MFIEDGSLKEERRSRYAQQSHFSDGGISLRQLICVGFLWLAFSVFISKEVQAEVVFSEIARADRLTFVCNEKGDQKMCFDQYIAFTGQYIYTSDSSIVVEDLRCASLELSSSPTEFSLTGRLVQKSEVQDSPASRGLLRIRFYTRGSVGEPVEVPRSNLTYLLVKPYARSNLSSGVDQGNEPWVRKFAKYFPECKFVNYVSTELLPFANNPVGGGSMAKSRRNPMQPKRHH